MAEFLLTLKHVMWIVAFLPGHIIGAVFRPRRENLVWKLMRTRISPARISLVFYTLLATIFIRDRLMPPWMALIVAYIAFHYLANAALGFIRHLHRRGIYEETVGLLPLSDADFRSSYRIVFLEACLPVLLSICIGECLRYVLRTYSWSLMIEESVLLGITFSLVAYVIYWSLLAAFGGIFMAFVSLLGAATFIVVGGQALQNRQGLGFVVVIVTGLYAVYFIYWSAMHNYVNEVRLREQERKPNDS